MALRVEYVIVLLCLLASGIFFYFFHYCPDEPHSGALPLINVRGFFIGAPSPRVPQHLGGQVS